MRFAEFVSDNGDHFRLIGLVMLKDAMVDQIGQGFGPGTPWQVLYDAYTEAVKDFQENL